MEKNLPKIFKCQKEKFFTNNSNYFYGEYKNKQTQFTVDELFKTNEIYRTSVKLTLNDKVVYKTIIGRTQNNLITYDNEIIPISDIIKIENN